MSLNLCRGVAVGCCMSFALVASGGNGPSGSVGGRGVTGLGTPGGVTTPVAESGAESCCDYGKPVIITMEYTGEDCSATSTTQDPDKYSCDDFGPLPNTAFILATNKEDPNDAGADVFHVGAVSVGSEYEISALTAGENKLPSKTFIHLFDMSGGALLQTIEFHTSCSQDLFHGDQFGASLIVACVGEDQPIPGPDDCDGCNVTNNGLIFEGTLGCETDGLIVHKDVRVCFDPAPECPKIPQPEDCCEDGKPAQLIMEWTGEDCSATYHTQDPDKVSCDDFGPLTDPVYIIASEKDDCTGLIWFEGYVSVGDEYILDAASAGEDRLKSSTHICVFDDAPGAGGTLVQQVEFHTSCSQDLYAGFQFGGSLLVGCVGKNVPVPGDCCNDGKPAVISMEYTGLDCSATSTNQDPGKYSCTDYGALGNTVFIRATDKSGPYDTSGKIWFEGTVSIGDVFNIDAGTAGESKLGSKTFIHIFDMITTDDDDGGGGAMVLQSVEFHTSCSQPLAEGDQFGASLIVGCIGEDAPVDGDCCVEGKPVSITMEFTGDDCSATSTFQEAGKFDCDDFGVIPATAFIRATDRSGPYDTSGNIWFEGMVTQGDSYVIDAANAGEDKLKNTTYIHIFDMGTFDDDDGAGGAMLLQTVKFHTSCSQPIIVGDQYGASLITECVGEDGPVIIPPDDSCDPFPDDGYFTYVYKITNDSDSAVSILGLEMSVAVNGDNVIDAGFLEGPGVQPIFTLVEPDRVTWFFNPQVILPGEMSVELYIVSPLGPDTVGFAVLGEFGLDCTGECVGPAVVCQFCFLEPEQTEGFDASNSFGADGGVVNRGQAFGNSYGPGNPPCFYCPTGLAAGTEPCGGGALPPLGRCCVGLFGTNFCSLTTQEICEGQEGFISWEEGEFCDQGNASCLPMATPDECEGAIAISGEGDFDFDNSDATSVGPDHVLCEAFGSGAIDNDVWFLWTAPCNAEAIIQTCGGTAVDTKIAVYFGGDCPVTDGRLAGCNDDTCGLQSAVQFTAREGDQYLFRIGTFPGAAGGTGTFNVTCLVAADNNLCDGATAISGEGTFEFDNMMASTDGAEDVLCDAFGSQQVDNDVWFCWTAPCDGEAIVTTCDGTAVDTKIAAYDGCACPTGPAIACNDDTCGLQSTVMFATTEGAQYLIRIGTFPGAAGGTGTFDITCMEGGMNEPGANGWADASPLSGTGMFMFDNSAATTDGLEDAACDSFGSQQIDNDVWFCWTASESGTVTVETCGGTGVDTKIAAYRGCGSVTGDNGLLDCNDDTCGLQSSVSFTAGAGASYLIRIGTFPGAAGGTGTFSLSVGVPLEEEPIGKIGREIIDEVTTLLGEQTSSQ